MEPMKRDDHARRSQRADGVEGDAGSGLARGERLQKYLARSGVASRRHAEELIVAGAVTVNGQVVRELGTRVNPDVDEVRVHGELARPPSEHLYVLLNKPTDTITTMRDTHGRRTVLDLLPAEWRAHRVFPVGRLDRESEGLLLLTNDGEMAARLMHPRYALPKEYHAVVIGHPTRDEILHLERGILLPGDARPTAPARVWTIRRAGANSWMGIELHEGRNRQVRHMFEAVGHPVLRLERVRVGPLTLGDLARGAVRILGPQEVEALRRAVSADPSANPAR